MKTLQRDMMVLTLSHLLSGLLVRTVQSVILCAQNQDLRVRNVAWPALPDNLDSLNLFLNGLWAVVHSETITAG